MPPDGENIDPVALQRENAELRASLEAARRQASEESARADTLDNQVSQTGVRMASAQIAQVAAQETAAADALTAIEQEIKNLKVQAATLMSEGKFAEHADVNEAIGDATARRRQAMQAKEYYGNQRTQLASAPTDRVEQFLAAKAGDFSNEDAEWIRRNPRYATDTNFNRRVAEAHHEALTKLNLTQRSPEYYEHLSKRGYMRGEPVERAAEERPREDQQQQQAAPTGYGPGAVETSLDDDGAPQIIIEERPMPQYNQPPPDQDSGETFNRPPAAPQPRAAGAGSLRSAIAAAPSRGTIGTRGDGRRTVVRLTPGERDTAMSIAPFMMSDKVLEGGEAAILTEYQRLKESPTAERIRQGWLDRRQS